MAMSSWLPTCYLILLKSSIKMLRLPAMFCTISISRPKSLPFPTANSQALSQWQKTLKP